MVQLRFSYRNSKYLGDLLNLSGVILLIVLVSHVCIDMFSQLFRKYEAFFLEKLLWMFAFSSIVKYAIILCWLTFNR